MEDERPKISYVRRALGIGLGGPIIVLFLMFATGRWRAFQVVSNSMYPTLQIGDNLLMKPATSVAVLKDMIIVFPDPKIPTDMLTKRVLAEGPERVRLKRGRLYIGSDRSPHGDGHVNRPDKTWEVKEGELFVVGDNFEDSVDSIDFGPIQRSDVKGILTYRYLPWSRRGSVVNTP